VNEHVWELTKPGDVPQWHLVSRK